ncbi:PREDICTED: zinc finger protein 761-like [Papilio xuthus]|uniref:PR domain zinc finger protein 14 n=1 Tax=Papilio xuthus TaxID=66420 RepID=A0A194QAH9_PAPXU|nr:PREDICTED: zinc finger protein 761-like [Papilio xuthus]KPJ00421.1 PR domain zinc finger protein 14 [Papilio xuthus]
MNKKPKSGPRIRITRQAFRKKEEGTEVKDESNFIYTCQYCRVKFTQNSHFFRHMTSNHQAQQKEATYECNECQIIFTKKNMLDLHYRKRHQIKSKSKCESCAITFKSRYCLRRHMKLKQIMNENSCVKCQKKFTNKDLLLKHVKNKHTFKNATYECEHCTLKFKAKKSLQTHLSRIHKRL